MNPKILLLGIVIWICVHQLFEAYLSYRQIQNFKNAKSMPDELKSIVNFYYFDKARLYSLDVEKFVMIFKILSLLIVLLDLYNGFMPTVWQRSFQLADLYGFTADNEILISCIYMIISNFIMFLQTLPFDIYLLFELERLHGFQRVPLIDFLVNSIASFLSTQLLLMPVTSTIIYIVKTGGKNVFIYLWIFTSALSLLLIFVHPMLIRTFNSCQQLENEQLRLDIEKLVSSQGFSPQEVCVVPGSMRGNAYFYGFGNFKGIVIDDTLLLNKGRANSSELKVYERGRGCPNDEVLGIIAHELGHWKNSHVIKDIAFEQLRRTLTFTILSQSFGHSALYEAVGFEPGVRPIIVGLSLAVGYVMSPFTVAVNFLFNLLSRHFEYEADEFALKLGYSNSLQNALIRIQMSNLAFPCDDWLYSAYYHSHPTLLQRINRLKSFEK